MMKLQEYFNRDRIAISCELFPPKTDKGLANMLANVERLMSFEPDFITCTYGAGGSQQDRTMEVLRQVRSRFDIPVASHLTLVGSTIDDLRGYLRLASNEGVEFIVALRGDPPAGASSFQQHDGGLCYANELVELIRGEFPEFGVAVAGYPEVHQEAPNAAVDLENLKLKVDAGADAVITQLFFDNTDFFEFRDRCRAAGIDVPIVPGIMPVTNLKQIKRIAELCGASLPTSFTEKLAASDDPDWQFQVGVEQAISQIAELIDHQIDGLHFYVLNRSDAATAILQAVEITSRITGSPEV